MRPVHHLRPGKLPAEQLASLLSRIPANPRVLVGPGLGRDAAVIDLGGGRVLVATTDPITFASDDIGRYAVHVNANDIACTGARPSWFMATLLLPAGSPATLPSEIMRQLTDACGELGIALVGGHTEVTLGIERPIVVGTMFGEAARADMVIGEHIAPGDAVIMTKPIAIEGTALLARDHAATLTARGVVPDVIRRAAELLSHPGISVVGDARSICALIRPRLMHDPTEGGIATALHEMAAAAGATLRIDGAAIAVREESRAVCGALNLDPLGLLASGTLLAIIDSADEPKLSAARTSDDLIWTRIGTVESGPPRVILADEDSATPLPTFARDELARFLESETAVGEHTG